MLAPLIALLPFFPYVFDALPVRILRPAPVWDEGADVWLHGESADDEMVDLVATSIEEFSPMPGEEIEDGHGCC